METSFLQDSVTLPYLGEFHSQRRPVTRYEESTPSGQGILIETSWEQTDWEVPISPCSTDELEIHYDQWLYVGVPQAIEPYVPRIEPETIIDPSARPMLTDRVCMTLDRMIPLLKGEARRSFIPVSKVEVRGFVDPEEDTEEVVVIQWVEVSPQAALAYWDKLGSMIEFWIGFLPDELARIAIERLSFEVRWDINDAAL
jgi:hypothetical protein